VNEAGGLTRGDDEMGSRRGKPTDLARRCEAVGWEVTLSKAGHYRVKTHTGGVFSFASTPGDYRTGVNDESKAKKYGLHELEERLALKRERDRLQAIEDDKANGVDWEAEDRKRDEEKMKTNTEGDLGYVDGVAIAEIAPAMYAVKRPGEERRMVPHMQELLLADGSIRLRCEMNGDDGIPCHKTGPSVQAIAVHQARVHTGSYTFKDKTPPKEKVITVDKRGTVVDVKDASSWSVEDRIADLKEGESITLKADIVATPVENEVSELIEKQPGIVTRLVDLADELDDLVDDVTELAESVRVKRGELRKLLVELPLHLTDDDTKEKARKYDAMKKLLD
jgi:hypothetical protein